ncbi:MAG: ribonuclease D [Deltaproteobacteria bacterium]|nr:ribonuclease D [Deltaproteobacteria bacterium]
MRTTPLRPVKLIDGNVSIQRLAEDLARFSVIGLDVETTLGAAKYMCLAQVATPEYTALVDTWRLQDISALKPVLESERVVKVIHNASFERDRLADRGITLRGVYDTLAADRRLNPQREQHGLKALVRLELGVQMDEAQQTSDWRRRPLTSAQLNYAALDAEVLLDLYARFAPRLPTT